MPVEGSTVVRRQLGRRLRALREAAGKTIQDVQEAGIGSRQKIWRIEKGDVKVSIGDVRALCWLYGVDGPTTDILAALAIGTTAQGWWEDYGDIVPNWFGLYVGLEAAAAEAWIYDPELPHGLFQTPEYLRALFTDSGVKADERTVERQVKLRKERQQTITSRKPPLRVTAVLGAGVLARQVGGEAVMTQQVEHMRTLTRLAHVDIRVLPWSIGGHAAQRVGAFTILDFADPDDPSVAYQESATGAIYREKSEEIAEYHKIFELVYQKSVAIEEYQL